MTHKTMSLAHTAYRELLKRIVSLDIRPGALLQERALAEELHMSRTPVREALNRLEQESWVKINARSNITVKGIEERDVRELFAARKIMELRGMDYIFANGLTVVSTAELSAALGRMQQGSLSDYDFNKADIDFHEVLALADNNSYVGEFWRRIMLENARMGLVAFEVFKKDSAKICGEHLDVLHGMAEACPGKARAALERHLDEVMNAILRVISPRHEYGTPEELLQAVHAARARAF